MDGPGVRHTPGCGRNTSPHRQKRCLLIRTANLRGAHVVFSVKRPTRTDVCLLGIGQVFTKCEPLQQMRSDIAVVLFLRSGQQLLRPKAEHYDGVFMSDGFWQLTLDCWKTSPNERPDMSEVVDRLQLLQVG
jgi:hypothetical protein